MNFVSTFTTVAFNTERKVVAVEREQVLNLYRIITLLFALLALSTVFNYQAYYGFKPLHDKISDLEKENAQLITTRDNLQAQVDSFNDLKVAVKKIIATHSVGLADATMDYLARLEIASSQVTHIPLSIGLKISIKESHFQQNAISYNNSSHGVKQLNFNAHKRALGIDSPEPLYNPAFNIPHGYAILKDYINLRGGMFAGLAQYYGTDDPIANAEYAADILAGAIPLKKKLPANLIS